MDGSRSGVAEQILDAGADIPELVPRVDHQIAVEVGGADDAGGGADSHHIALETVPVDQHIGLAAIDFNAVIIGVEEEIAVNVGVPVEPSDRRAVGGAAESVVPPAVAAADEIVVAYDRAAAGIPDEYRHRAAGV